MKIVVLGKDGQLGQEICQAIPGVIGLSREAADLARPVELRRNLEAIRPSLVINCGAYTHVDRAEAEPEQVFAVNGWGVRDLALACRDLDCVLVHFSTNYVFGADEARSTPYCEDDLPGPSSTYGISKLAGEQFIQSLCPRHFILRTCGLYGRHGISTKRSNFVETMLRKGAEGRPLRIVDDQICTPTAAADLAQAIADMLTSDSYGLYHVTNAGECSWRQFAQTIFTLSGQSVPLIPIRSDELQMPAKRPRYSVLQCDRWAHKGFIPLRPWQDALRGYLSQRQKLLCAA